MNAIKALPTSGPAAQTTGEAPSGRGLGARAVQKSAFAGLLATLDQGGRGRSEPRARKTGEETASVQAQAQSAMALASMLQQPLILPRPQLQPVETGVRGFSEIPKLHEMRGSATSLAQNLGGSAGLQSRSGVASRGGQAAGALAAATTPLLAGGAAFRSAAERAVTAKAPRPELELPQAGKAEPREQPSQVGDKSRATLAARAATDSALAAAVAKSPLLAGNAALRQVQLAHAAQLSGLPQASATAGRHGHEKLAVERGKQADAHKADKAGGAQGHKAAAGAGVEGARESAAESQSNVVDPSIALRPVLARDPSLAEPGTTRTPTAPREAAGEVSGLAGSAGMNAGQVRGPQFAPMQEAAPPSAARQLAEFVAAKVPEAPTRFDLTLHPDNLGTVDVRLSVQGDAVQLAMITQNGETRELLSREMGELRQALADKGLQLAGADVSTREDAQRQAATSHFEREDRQGAHHPSPRGEHEPRAAAATSSAPAPGPAAPRILNTSGLDIHA